MRPIPHIAVFLAVVMRLLFSIISGCGSILVLTVLIIVGGCSGGGGGGGGAPATADSNAPLVTLTFPPPFSLTDADTMTFTGSATDKHQVESVVVQGIPATSENGFVSWKATVPLAFGLNKVLVQSLDRLGNKNTKAAQARIYRETISLNSPVGVTTDIINDRALVTDTYYRALFAVDFDTGSYTVVSDDSHGTGPVFDEPSGVVYDWSGHRALIVDAERLFEVNLDNGNRAVISDDSHGSGPGLIYAFDLALDTINHRVIAIDVVLNALIGIDLNSGMRTIISDPSHGSGPGLNLPMGIALDLDSQCAWVVDASLVALFRIDLATGNRTVVSDPSHGFGPAMLWPNDIAVDPTLNIAMVTDAGREALIKINLDNGFRTLVSDDSHGSGRKFAFLQSVTFGLVFNHVILVDSIQGSLFEVDIHSGDRSLISGAFMGKGRSLCMPTGIDYDPATNRALVIDDDFNNPALVAIDLQNGDRTMVSCEGMGSGPNIIQPQGMAYNPVEYSAVVIDSGMDALFEIDLLNGNRTIKSHNSTQPPYLDHMRDTTLYPNMKIALVLTDETLLLVKLSNGNSYVVSDATHGTGPIPVDFRGIALHPDNAHVLVTDQGLDAVLKIHLYTGNREILSNDLTGSGPALESPSALAIDPDGNRVLVLQNPSSSMPALLAVDMETGDRLVVSDMNIGKGPMFHDPTAIAINPNSNHALVTSHPLHALFAINLLNGDRVIQSK